MTDDALDLEHLAKVAYGRRALDTLWDRNVAWMVFSCSDEKWPVCCVADAVRSGDDYYPPMCITSHVQGGGYFLDGERRRIDLGPPPSRRAPGAEDVPW